MERIKFIVIAACVSFLSYIAYLIVKGKLREEYAIVWLFSALVLIVFSFWRSGLDLLAHFFGIYDPPNMIFTGAIFIIMIYLLHNSVVLSKLQKDNKTLSQTIALLKEKLEKEKKSDPEQ